MPRDLPLATLPRKPRLPAMPTGNRPLDLPALEKLDADPHRRDQWGLDIQVFPTPVSPLARSYLARALEFFGYPKNVNPSTFVAGGGTIPEMVTVGGLLMRGYVYNQQAAPGFTFQSSELGGRAAGGGGAVLDVVIFEPHRVVGVRVQSFFHALGGAYAGRAKVEADINQRVKLQSSGAVQAIYDINDPTHGCPLEFLGDAAVLQDFERMFNA